MIWFWLAFVAIMSLYGLFKWLYYFTLDSRKSFILQFLEANRIDYTSENTTSYDIEMLRSFVDRYCRQDGILLSVNSSLYFSGYSCLSLCFRLRIAHDNLNSVIVGELVCGLWDHWSKQRKIHIQPLPQYSDNYKWKHFDDHENNQLGSVPSKPPISIINDDHYVILPTRFA